MDNLIDLTIIVGYLSLIVAIGLFVALRGRKKSQDSAQNYCLASGTLKWPVIGLALFSTNISTIHLVAFAQEGVVNGLAYGNFEWMAAFTLIILSLFFVPFYIRAKVTTLTDFLEKRYNGTCRVNHKPNSAGIPAHDRLCLKSLVSFTQMPGFMRKMYRCRL